MLAGLIAVCVTAVVLKPKLQDTTQTPATAMIDDANAIEEELKAYHRITTSKRNLTAEEYGRLSTIAKLEPFEANQIRALTLMVAHVRSVQGSETAQRRTLLLDQAKAMLTRKDATYDMKTIAICALRDLESKEARELVKPFRQSREKYVAAAAESYFKKMDGKKSP